MTAKKIIAAVLALALIVVLVGGVLYVKHFTQDFTQPFAKFYVRCGKKDVFTESIGNVFSKKLTLEPRYTFNRGDSYTYEIVPLQELEYTVDGQLHKLSEITSLRGSFAEVVSNKAFEVDFSKLTVVKVLEAYYNASVELLQNVPEGDLFKLQFVSFDGETTVNICFSIAADAVKTDVEITLDISEVIF